MVLRTTELFKTACALQMNHIYSLEIHTVENEALLHLWNRDTACTVHKGSLWKPFSANEKNTRHQNVKLGTSKFQFTS